MGKFSFTKLVLAGIITVGVLGCGGNAGLAQSQDETMASWQPLCRPLRGKRSIPW